MNGNGKKTHYLLDKETFTMFHINESIQDIPDMSRHRTLHHQYTKMKIQYKVDKETDKK